MKYTPLLLLLMLFSCNNDKKTKTIQVTGEGKIRIMPNVVNLTINVSFTKPKMVDAVKQTQATVDTVMLMLEQFGRKNEDIKTSSISANKNYEYIRGVERFTGYQAQQTIDFVLNDLNKFTELTGKLLGTKISSISNIQFNHSKADSLLREADLLAYDDALKSAKKLSDRAHVKLGKLVYLSNHGDNGKYNDDADYSVRSSDLNTYEKGYGGRGFRISPEVIEFKRRVVSEFEIDD